MGSGAAMIIAAVKANDLETAKSLIAQGADLEAIDENGWTALCWAASRGNCEAIDLLCDAGASPFKSAEDERTPYKIALAAAHRQAAGRLRAWEQATGSDLDRSSSRQGESRLYCKAYRIAELRRFPLWSALTNDCALSPEDTVFIHQNYTVTRSIWHGKDTVLENVTPEWRTFCANDLGFKVPDDFDLIGVQA